ncbi:MAG: ABC transporter permease [Cryobacterium sp.]|nr:ABC transporter permease [Oligoflexia bacterium]
MLTFLIRRIIAAVPIIFGVALVVFLLFNVVGGDPAIMMVGKHATAQQMADIRHEYGLDKPLPIQFLNYLKEITTFEFGRSYATRQKISDMIVSGIGPSLSLTLPAFFITTLISVILGLFVAYFRGKLIDRIGVILCVIGMSIPSLAYILFGQYYLAYEMRWFPISGYDYSFPGRFDYLALPIVLWLLLSIGYDVRFYRTAILEETSQDYVRTARAKGMSEPRIFLKHVLKNSMVPIVTNVVLEIPLLILGSFLFETFFGIPGLGSITIDALHNSDFPVIKTMAFIMSLLLIFGNILTDIVYSLVDPRVKLK